MLEIHTKAFDIMPQRPGILPAPAALCAASVILLGGNAVAAEFQYVTGVDYADRQIQCL